MQTDGGVGELLFFYNRNEFRTFYVYIMSIGDY
ncbi:hypothetical protein J2Z23_000810 [Lederbergia galactosidilyticus]|nr:hypothetical protein [Lederbergia galactosidilytica]